MSKSRFAYLDATLGKCMQTCIIFLVFLSFVIGVKLEASDVTSKPLDATELVLRDNVYYKKFSQEPFTGYVINQSGIRLNPKYDVLEERFRFTNEPDYRLQVQENFYLKAGQKDGQAAAYYADGQLAELFDYKNGVIHGFTKRYFQSGGLYSNQAWRDGRPEGLIEKFYENGVVKLREVIADGEWVDGSIETYYDNGKLLKKRVLSACCSHTKEYYKSGQIRSEVTFIENPGGLPLKDGAQRGFHPNGQLEYEWFFDKDKRVGTHRDFHEDGTVKVIEEYKDDRLVSSQYFHPSGLVAEAFVPLHESGRELLIEYWENGSIKRLSEYSNGKRNKDGISANFDKNGELIR